MASTTSVLSNLHGASLTAKSGALSIYEDGALTYVILPDMLLTVRCCFEEFAAKMGAVYTQDLRASLLRKVAAAYRGPLYRNSPKALEGLDHRGPVNMCGCACELYTVPGAAKSRESMATR
jgi:hypothetical protein